MVTTALSSQNVIRAARASHFDGRFSRSKTRCDQRRKRQWQMKREERREP